MIFRKRRLIRTLRDIKDIFDSIDWDNFKGAIAEAKISEEAVEAVAKAKITELNIANLRRKR